MEHIVNIDVVGGVFKKTGKDAIRVALYGDKSPMANQR
jgi:hypothetical protein